MNASSAVIRVDKLQKTYVLGFFRKKVRAIEDVSLSVEPGEIFGLLGPNGAGKTTTIKCLFGLVRPTSGSAEVLGMPAADIRAKRRVGYLPEAPYFYDYLTAREFLVFIGELCDLSRKKARARAGELLERVDLKDAADMAMRRYSKGMLQRVGVAQALIHDPELVVLDEPLSGLDPLGRKELRELISELRAEGKTVMISSHILSDVELLADRVAILVRGRTAAIGRLEELLDTRVTSTEVVYSAADDDAAEAARAALEPLDLRAERHGETFTLALPGDEHTDTVIDALRGAGARIVAVSPRKESLEDVVVRRAEGDGKAEDEGKLEEEGKDSDDEERSS